MRKWLELSCFPSEERSTYDRREKTAMLYIHPVLGDKITADISAVELNSLWTKMMHEGYAQSTVKRAYLILNQFFRCLYHEEWIPKNPMERVRMVKKANFLAAQGKDNLPPSDCITVLTEEEIERIKRSLENRGCSSFDGKQFFAPVSPCIALCAICWEKQSKYPTKSVRAVSAIFERLCDS